LAVVKLQEGGGFDTDTFPVPFVPLKVKEVQELWQPAVYRQKIAEIKGPPRNRR